MKAGKKALLLALCAIVLVIATVLGTMAYLTDTKSVVNTFTVGNVQITLDEAKVNADGTLVPNAARVTGNAYHLLPGHTYTKDPTVTVVSGSEDAYVRMLVKVEGLASLKNAMPKDKFPTFYNDDLFLLQNLCVDENGALTWDNAVWQYVTFDQATSTYEFRYANKVAKNNNAETVLPALFKTITVPGAIKNTELALLDAVEIEVTAHAIQADGFKNAAEAWDAWSN